MSRINLVRKCLYKGDCTSSEVAALTQLPRASVASWLRGMELAGEVDVVGKIRTPRGPHSALYRLRGLGKIRMRRAVA